MIRVSGLRDLNTKISNSPYSAIPLPHSPQNSLVNFVPLPLSETWVFGAPDVMVRVERGSLVVMPEGPPVNLRQFYWMSVVMVLF